MKGREAYAALMMRYERKLMMHEHDATVPAHVNLILPKKVCMQDKLPGV